MSLRWEIDECSERWIGGWIDDNGPVDSIEITVNGRRIATLSPTDYREDLEDAGFGDGRRSFGFAIGPHLTQPINVVTVTHGLRVLHTAALRPPALGGVVAFSAPTIAEQGRTKKVLFLQTADQVIYRPVLEMTSRTVLEYCTRNRFAYQSYFGIFRGFHAWHATFNRILLLRQILNTGFDGWVCYIDADAFIADLEFNLLEYLSDKNHIAFIAATDYPHQPDRPYWFVNAGTFMINLGAPVGQRIVRDWARRFDAITDDELRDMPEWSYHDQPMLQQTLSELPDGASTVLTLRGEPNLMNYRGGIFIRQILREHGSLDDRIAALRSETDRVLGVSSFPILQASSARPLQGVEEAFLRAVYRVLLLREPDVEGLTATAAAMREQSLDFEAALRSCLKSPEFQQKIPQFLQTYADMLEAARLPIG